MVWVADDCVWSEPLGLWGRGYVTWEREADVVELPRCTHLWDACRLSGDEGLGRAQLDGAVGGDGIPR